MVLGHTACRQSLDFSLLDSSYLILVYIEVVVENFFYKFGGLMRLSFVGGCSFCGKASDQCNCVKDFNEYSFLSQVETGSPPTSSELLHEIKLLKREISEIRRELKEVL